jgi:hypothetical protein
MSATVVTAMVAMALVTIATARWGNTNVER